MDRVAVDIALCDALAARAVGGDEDAFQKLIEHLWPLCLVIVQSSRAIRRLGGTDDHVRDVLTRLVDKLSMHRGSPRASQGSSTDGGAALRLYRPWCERHPGKTFEDWIRIVTTNLVRDYAREQSAGRRSTRSLDDAEPKMVLNEFARSPVIERLETRPPFTAAQTARELLAFAETRLDAESYRALTSWIQGASFKEIADELGETDATRARQLVRAAVALLRRKFAEGEGADDFA